MATPLHAARAAAVVIDRIAIGGRTGCGGLGGTPRLHRRQGEIPRLRGADAPNRRIKRRGGCRPDQIPRSGRGIPYFDTARKRQRTVRRACRHHRHRAARPCGTRQIPDEAEAGRARRARWNVRARPCSTSSTKWPARSTSSKTSRYRRRTAGFAAQITGSRRPSDAGRQRFRPKSR